MKNYQCEICGKKHNVYYSVRCPEPDYLHNLSEEEREKRVEGVGSLLLFDKDFFLVKGNICIEVKELSTWTYFQVWARIEIEDFQKKLEEVRKDIFDTPLVGRLEDDIPYYENVKNLKMDVVLPNKDGEVIFEILEENHPMSIDQKNGISKEKLISWIQKIYHAESKPKSEKPFQIRFEEIIKEAKEDYLAKQKSFVINVSTAMVLFQIISLEVIEKEVTKNEFIIYLPFDISSEEAELELEKFKQTKYFNQFEIDIFDGMPTYYLAIKNDDTALINLSSQIINDVYEEKIDDIDFDIFEP